jgi:hypothetical protein
MTTTESPIDKNLSKLEAQLQLWSTKLEEAVTRTGQRAQVESKKQLEELRSRLGVARAKLDEAKAAGSEKWDTLKEGVEHLWEELESTFKKLIH